MAWNIDLEINLVMFVGDIRKKKFYICSTGLTLDFNTEITVLGHDLI